MAIANRRILYVSHKADRTGAPGCILDLVRGLDRTRFESAVVLGEDGPLREDLEALGVPVFVYSRRRMRGVVGVWTAIRTIRRCRADVVHVNRAVGDSKTYAIAARLCRRPLVWHLHDEFHHKKLQRRKPWVERLSTVAVSCAYSVVRDLNARRVEVIWNGVEFDQTEERSDLATRVEADGLGQVAFRFLFAGAFTPRKNVLLLVQAANQLANSVHGVELVLVGGGEDDPYREQTVRLAATAKLRNRVRVLASRSDIRPLIAASDALVLPSRSEACPRVILEAAALCVPTLATDVGDVSRLVDHGETGWVIPREPLTPEGLAEAMERVVSEGRVEARRRGIAARRKLEPLAALSSYLGGFEDLYASLTPP